MEIKFYRNDYTNGKISISYFISVSYCSWLITETSTSPHALSVTIYTDVNLTPSLHEV